jgi:hypothetical protein
MDHDFHHLPQYRIDEIFSQSGKSEILGFKAGQMAMTIADTLMTDNALFKLFETGGELTVEYDFYPLRPYLGKLALNREQKYYFINTSIQAGISLAFKSCGEESARPYDIEPTYPPHLPYYIFATVTPQTTPDI